MNVFDRLLSSIAPHICVGCGAEGSLLCMECVEQLPYLQAGICYLCGRLSRDFKVCVKCADSTTLQYVYVVAQYKDLAKELIAAYKFNDARAGAVPIAHTLNAVLPYFADAPAITFVPTLPQHARVRGFDHAQLLAKELSRLRSWHYAPQLLRQKSLQQHGATRAERQRQIKGAFRAIAPERINGRHVLLVDDVVTTGATLTEAARMLKKAGAGRIDAVVFARTPEK